jgi:hypothetical protein
MKFVFEQINNTNKNNSSSNSSNNTISNERQFEAENETEALTQFFLCKNYLTKQSTVTTDNH